MPTHSYHRRRTTITELPPQCPIDHEWSPVDDYLADPYPIATRFGEEFPVMFVARLGYVVVSRMEDSLAVLTDPDTYASVNVQDPVRCSPTPVRMDG